MITLNIKQEFKDLIPKLSDIEYNQLESNILEDGIIDPIRVIERHDAEKELQYLIIDGHNRYEISKKHGIDFRIMPVEGIETDEQVINWIIDNQVGRRNLTQDQLKYFRGKKYNLEKKESHRPTNKVDNLSPLKTADKLAKEFNVSGRTIIREAKAVEIIDQIPEVQQAVKDGEMKLTEAIEVAEIIQDENIAIGDGDILEKAKEIRKKKRSESKPITINVTPVKSQQQIIYESLYQRIIEMKSADEIKSFILNLININNE